MDDWFPCLMASTQAVMARHVEGWRTVGGRGAHLRERGTSLGGQVTIVGGQRPHAYDGC